MSTVVAALVVAALTGAPEQPPVHQDPWRPDVSAAARFAGARAGDVAFAVRVGDRVRGRGLDRQFRSASVIKAMFMVAYLRRPSVRARALDADDRALLAPMIRRSDNDAATAIRNLLGNAAVERLARRAGMTRFVVDPVWGYSLITPRDQTRFFLTIDSLVPARHRAYATRLLRTIVPSQRWGMAQAIPEGWRLYFKGGWGSGSGAVDHQVGLLRRGEHRISVAVMTTGNPGHAYGKATLEGVTRRLLRGLGPQVVGTAGASRGYVTVPDR
jgi:beta-lactamase class A